MQEDGLIPVEEGVVDNVPYSFFQGFRWVSCPVDVVGGQGTVRSFEYIIFCFLCVMYVTDNLTVGFRKSEYLYTKKKQDRNEDSIYQRSAACGRSFIHFSGIFLGLFDAPFFVWMVLRTSAVKLLRTAGTTRSKVRVV